jgi:hypothetical protein
MTQINSDESNNSSSKEPFKNRITIDDLSHELLSKEAADDYPLLQVERALQEDKHKRVLRYLVLLVALILIAMGTATSIVIFLYTRNPFSVLSSVPAVTTAGILIITYAGRFLFWRDSDYELAMKKLEYRSRKAEAKQTSRRGDAK